MMIYQIGGALILLLGVALFAASKPAVRIIPNSTQIAAQVGDRMLAWLTRVFAAILMILGLVTLLHI